jgi:hypothetical protein
MTSGGTSSEVSEQRSNETSEARVVADTAALAAIADLIVEMREDGLEGWSTAPGERTRRILVMCVGEAEAQRLWPTSKD